jgi:hypothetical protein
VAPNDWLDSPMKNGSARGWGKSRFRAYNVV